ncbi:sodium-translocating pyrophosphatase, partial [Candidatus Woesearchaeota archaeon]|nr:sodium-translocating pyrophosphatase [Candidatus Woesearchaeota archaeon]
MISILAIVVSLVALAYAGYLSLQILKVEPGNEKMQQIANAIKEGAMTYMARQYKTISIFAVAITALLWILFSFPIAAGFLFGAILSGISGYIGMSISVQANVRTAQAAKKGIKEALSVAFKGGSVTGMAVVGLALLAVSVFYTFYSDPAMLVGLGFGAS